MAATHFTGPVRAGNILNTSGTTVGTDVANVGYVLMSQSSAVTQATNVASAGVYKTSIVLPANSQIVSIKLFVTTVWDGVAATFNVGTSATGTELAVAATTTNTGAAVGIVDVLPGTDATRTGEWIDVGTTDVQIYMKSTNTGAGVGNIVVNYIQARDATP